MNFFLKTAHGTFIGSIRLDGHKPTQLQLDSMFSFGASTRKYILRERPNATIPLGSSLLDDLQMEGGEGALLGLPESQTELDVSNFNQKQTVFKSELNLFRILRNTIQLIIAEF